MGRSIIVASGNGGAGKTTFAVNMGAGLALQGYKVCLLDFNMGLRNLDIYMGLQDKVVFDIGDVMSGMCKVERTLIRDSHLDNLYLLSSTQNKIIKDMTDGHAKALVKHLKSLFDYVIIDAPAGIGKDLELAAGGADSAVLVLTPDYLSLRGAEALDKRLGLLGVRSRCYVINQVYQGELESGVVPDLDVINKTLSIPMAGIIPFDINIHLGNNSGNPVVLAKNSYVANNFMDIIHRMLG